MADYKLRLDIDEKELQRKIQSALKGAKIDSTIFGSGGSDSMSKSVQKTGKLYDSIVKKIEIMHKTDYSGKLKVIKASEKSIMHIKKETQAIRKLNDMKNITRQREMKDLSLRNAVARGVGGGPFKSMLGLTGGRAGGAVGTGLDMIAANSRFYNPKAGKGLPPGFAGGAKGSLGAEKGGALIDFVEKQQQKQRRLPQAVKIMGIAAGLAGAAGLGKLIIDSSPMMKAMLKLLNVAVMFILRPIGDMIGFILRPLFIMFVKASVTWFKFWKGAYPTWKGIGDTIGKFFEDPIGALAGLIPSIPDIFGCGGDIGGIDVGAWWTTVTSALSTAWGGFYEWLETNIWSKLKTAWDVGVQLFDEIFQDENIKAAWDTVVGFIKTMASSVKSSMGQGWIDIIKFFVKLGLDITGGLLSTWTSIVGFFKGIYNALKPIYDLFFGWMGTGGGGGSDDEAEEKNGDILSLAIDTFLKWIGIKESADDTAASAACVAQSFNQTAANIKRAPITTEGVMTALEGIMAKFKAAKDFVDAALRSIRNQKKLDGRNLTTSAKIAKKITNSTPWMQMMASSAGSVDRYLASSGTVTSNFAGGIINEPIFGVGASGRRYTFGERGPETITPGIGGGSGGGTKVYITIHASNLGDLERQLKPALLRIIKESTARVGIV